MKSIKTAIWILTLSTLYGTGILRIFNIFPEPLFCFSGAYAFFTKNMKSALAVALICSVLMAGLGNKGFIYSVLSCVYFAITCIAYTPKGKTMIKTLIFIFAAAFLFESSFYILFRFGVLSPFRAVSGIILPSAVYNTVLFVFILYGIRKSLTAKERYIFFK